MAMHYDALDKAPEVFRGIECGGCFFYTGLDLLEAGGSQTRSRCVRIREFPGKLKSSKDFGVRFGREKHLYPAQQPGDVRASAALRTEPPSGTKCSIQLTKKSLVVLHPVEGSGAENAVEFLAERQIQHVTANKFDVTGKIGLQKGSGLIDHVL